MRRIRYLDEAQAEFLHEIGYFTEFGTRRILLPRKFKFSFVYLTFPSEVVVIALASFSRKPGYWKSRIAA